MSRIQDNFLLRPEHMPTVMPIMKPSFILSKHEGWPPPPKLPCGTGITLWKCKHLSSIIYDLFRFHCNYSVNVWSNFCLDCCDDCCCAVFSCGNQQLLCLVWNLKQNQDMMMTNRVTLRIIVKSFANNLKSYFADTFTSVLVKLFRGKMLLNLFLRNLPINAEQRIR